MPSDVYLISQFAGNGCWLAVDLIIRKENHYSSKERQEVYI